MAQPLLQVKDLSVTAANRQILSDVSWAILPGELHVLMGPNGSGKSTLANALAGSPEVAITAGSARFAGKNLLRMTADERARAGMFLGFQYPVSISGLSLSGLLQAALNARQPKKAQVPPRKAPAAASSATDALQPLLRRVRLPPEISGRDINDGWSGGEKKKSEMAQLFVLQPKLAILDEPDSGLDIDAVKSMAQAIHELHQLGMTMLLITHYNRILKFLKPDAVHVMAHGRIVLSGGPELAEEIERKGYEKLISKS